MRMEVATRVYVGPKPPTHRAVPAPPEAGLRSRRKQTEAANGTGMALEFRFGSARTAAEKQAGGEAFDAR